MPRGVLYRAAVCPDGWSYLTNGLGQVVAITPGGVLEPAQDGLEGFEQVRVFVCGQDNVLYAAGLNGLSAFRRILTGRLEALFRIEPDVSIAQMAVGEDRFYVTGRRKGSSLPLHVLDRRGRVLQSFGESLSPFVTPQRPDDGFLLWDAATHELLYVPRRKYEIRVYDRNGKPSRIVTTDADIVRPARDPMRHVHEVIGAVRMNDGRVVTMMRGHIDGTVHPAFFLDVFDAELRPMETNIPGRYGWLAGAADGSVFLTTGSGDSMRITKARLAR